jgi:hypothetical protein
MNRTDLIQEMNEALPLFHPTREWLEDELLYLIVDDLARYLCSAASDGQWGEVSTGLAFLERALKKGDDDVRDAIYDGASILKSCDSVDLIKRELGPEMLDLWRRRDGFGWR